MKAPFLSLPENLALMAGAGAGKTHGLISLALHVLGGARPEAEPLAPARLFAVTFTEKAAAEMKERLRARVRALADGKREEPDLASAFELFGKPFPDVAFWERVHAGIGSAFIGTFHAFCAQLLRRFAVEAGLDPGFRLLEEGGALELFERCAEEAVLRDLESDGPEREAARALVTAFGFRGRGPGSGLVELLEKLHAKLAEDGRPADRLPEPEADGSFESARVALCAAVRAALQLAPEPPVQGSIAACGEALPTLERCTPADALRAAAVAGELADEIGLRVSKAAKAVLKPLRDELIPAFRLACGDVVAAPLHRSLVRTLGRVERAYRDEKERRGALDFSDLILRTRDLLRESASARLEVQARVGAMLVDEFQDTNRLQLDLVALLCERRDGAPRPIQADAFAELPLEPAMLACVGDRKQSIYEFRGADVSIFGDLARRFEGGDGRVEFLRHNRRSRPALISVFNRLFAQVMEPAAEPEPWRVEYVPEHDDLVAFRPEGPAGPCVELLAVGGENSEELRAAEARALAARIAALLGPEGPEVVGRDRTGGELRRAEGRDVAILLRRFTHLDVFRRELLARSIPHVVVRGGGFWTAREIVDLRCLLALGGDPTDRLALAAVLRSPLVALSDPTLAKLAVAGRLKVSALRAGIADLAPPDEVARLAPLLAVLEWLEPFARAAGVAAALERAISDLDLEAVLAAGFEGEQRVANLRKLVDWARAEDPPGAWAAARRLEGLAAAGGRESAAALIEESDPSAVRIMTIHQSKGLEFPVVFVPECGAGVRSDTDAVLYDRAHGLCVKPRGDDGRPIATTASKRVQEALLSRQRAESDRLFYVAATRARDLLVFSGESRRGTASWRSQLDRFLKEGEGPGLVRVPGPEDLVAPARPAGLEPAAAAPGAPIVAIAPPRVRAEALVAPVTQLGDYRICARRHFLAHVVGLEEGPWRLGTRVARRTGEPDPAQSAPGPGGETHQESGTREVGSLAHRILERFDFAAEAPAQVAARLSAEGASGADAEAVAADVTAFAHSPLGRELAAAPASRLWRELPFALALDGGDYVLHLRGKVDLLAVLGDGTALVLDYKHAHRPAEGVARYGFQLSCYALALKSFLPPQVPLRAGVAWLKDHGSPPDVLALDREALDRFRGELVEMGRDLLRRTPSRDFPVLEDRYCRGQKCGFRYVCHAPGKR